MTTEPEKLTPEDLAKIRRAVDEDCAEAAESAALLRHIAALDAEIKELEDRIDDLHQYMK